jgi:hypothetical protein
MRDTQRTFLDMHHVETMKERVDYTNMSAILGYMATEVVTMYENNLIKFRFVDFVERFVNVSFDVKEKVKALKKNPDLPRRDRDKQVSILR